jgi:Flp pilus assembly pilin Flp
VNTVHLSRDEEGAIFAEHVVLVALVAVGFADATVPLGAILVSYLDRIETVLALPVP